MRKIINLIIFLALLTTIVNAEIEREDFSAISQNKVLSICSCSVSGDFINIKNTGEETSVYSITSEGKTKDWITFYPNSLILGPGQEALVNSYIKPPCDIKGNFGVKTIITTGKGLKKQLTQDVSIDKCINFALELESFNNAGCPCSLLFYEFQIKNTGSFSEVYKLDIEESYKKWATLTADTIILGPEEKSSFSLYITSSCESYGSHKIDLQISSENSQLKASYPLEINILPCFNYSLGLGEYTLEDETFIFKEHPSSIYNLCEEELKIVPVLIENKADISNTYYLTLYGKKWAYLENDKLELNKSQKGIVNLVLNPKKIENKNYSMLLNIEALRGGITKDKPFSVNLEECYLPSITSQKKIKIDYSEIKTPVTIENKGNKRAIYSLFIEGEDWVKVEPSSIVIEPNKEETVYLHTLPSEDIKQGGYKTVLNVFVNESGKYYSKEINLKLKKPGMFSKIFGTAKDKIFYILGSVRLYLLYFIGGLALLIVLIIIISLFRRKVKKIPEEIKEEAKEEKAEIKKKIEKEVKEKVREEKKEEIKPKFKILYFLIIVIIGALLFFGIKYKIFVSIFSLVKVYLLHIVIGFISLIVLIIILNLTRTKVKVAEKKEKVEEKAKIEKKAKKEEKEEEIEEEKKPGFRKVILYSLIVIIIGALIFFGVRYQKIPVPETVLNVSIKVTSTLNAAKEGIKSNVLPKVTEKVIIPFKGLANKVYNYLKIYYLYIIIGFTVLVLVILVINIIRKRWKIIRRTIKKARKTLKSRFVKTKRLVGKRKFKRQSRNVLLVVFVLVILSLAGYYSVKNAPYIIDMVKNISIKKNITEEEFIIPTEEKGIKTQIWNEDRLHKIDLSKYFHDPDNDKLFYSSSYVENIIITIDNRTGVAKLKPDKDWYGKTFVVFTADDKKGGIVSSNIVTLIVRDVPESFVGDKLNDITSKLSNIREFISRQLKQLKDYFMLYINYIIFGLVILLVIILFSRFRKQIMDFFEEEEMSEEEVKKKRKK